MATLSNSIQGKRKFPRIEFRGRAVIFFGRDSEVSETLQVSEGGMMVHSKLRLNPADAVTVHFTVNTSYLRARCEVLYILPTETEGQNRIGLKFVSLLQEYREVLRDLHS